MGPQGSELVLVEAVENAQIVRFLTDSLLDPIEVEKISERLHDVQAESDASTMIIELKNVNALSTLMLSVLISLRKNAQAEGGDVRLAAVPERVDYVLKLTKLEDAFPTHATTQEAVEAVA